MKISALVLGALLVLAACGDTSSPAGRSIDAWRAKLAQGDSTAIDELGTLKAGAIPVIQTLLGDKDEVVVQSAAMAADEIGEAAAPLVPYLLAAMKRFPGQANVEQTLKGLKGAAIPAMVEALSSSDAAYKKEVAKLVGLMGTDAAPALPPLIAILEGGDPHDVKMEAIGSVAAISVKISSGDALPVLRDIQAAGNDLSLYAGRAITRIEHKLEQDAKIAAEEGR